MKRLLPLSAICCALVVAGCSNQPSANSRITNSTVSADTSLPAGWRRATAQGADISIGAAPGWTPIDLTAGDFSKIMESVEKDNKDIQQMHGVIQQMATNKTIKLFIFHTIDQESHFAPNVNVLVFPVPAGTDEQQLLDANEKNLQSTARGPIDRSDMNVGNDKVTEMSYPGQINSKGRQVPLRIINYFLFKNGNLYLVTFTTPASSFDSLKGEEQKMMESFRVG